MPPFVTEDVRERLRLDPVAKSPTEIQCLCDRAVMNQVHIAGLSYNTMITIIAALCSAQHAMRTGELPKTKLARDFYTICITAKTAVDTDEAVGALECCKLEAHRRLTTRLEEGGPAPDELAA